MVSRWNPEIHDPVLTGLHALSLTDTEITGRMLDIGYPVSREDVSLARRRLALKAHTPLPAYSHPPKAAYHDKPNPLFVAQMWLGKRLVEKPSGYWLDDLPVNIHQIMRACNRARVANGYPQIDANPRWRIDA